VRVRAVLDWLGALPVWQLVKSKVKAMKTFMRAYVRQVFSLRQQ
jgi:hypothetical protein